MKRQSPRKTNSIQMEKPKWKTMLLTTISYYNSIIIKVKQIDERVMNMVTGTEQKAKKQNLLTFDKRSKIIQWN